MDDRQDPTTRVGGGDTEAVDDGGDAAAHDHRPDAPPSDDEAHAADRFLEEQDPEDAERVAAHHREMDHLGAEVRGEGQID
jgi:hypothetical protein